MGIDYKKFKEIEQMATREIARFVSYRGLTGKELEDVAIPYISNRLFDFGLEILKYNKQETDQ